MVTIEQVKNGLTKYVDSEILPSISGGKRFALGVGAALAIKNLENTLNKYMNSPVLSALGILDDGSNIDIDKVYAAATETLTGMDKFSIDVPMLGVLTFRQGDLDALWAAIKEG